MSVIAAKGENMGARATVALRTWLAIAILVLVQARAAQGFVCVEVPKGTTKVKVKMIAVLATSKNNKVHPHLKCLAEQVQKIHPKLSGFRVAKMACKKVPLGGTESFRLVVDQKAYVTILKCEEMEKCVQVKIKPPTIGSITYTAKCKGFFPIITRYVTDKGELLIIAVSVQPCDK